MPIGVSSTGSVENRAAATITPFALAVASDGDVNGIHGEAQSVPIGALALTGAGSAQVTAALAKAIGQLSVSAAGSVEVVATATITLGAIPSLGYPGS